MVDDWLSVLIVCVSVTELPDSVSLICVVLLAVVASVDVEVLPKDVGT